MFKWEQKLVDWINRYMIHISIGFVMIAAAWMRMGGRNYVGIDYHYSLYDIPGNCNSLAYRYLADFLMLHFGDNAIIFLKYLAYAGDFAVAFLVLLLMRPKLQKGNLLKIFLVLTVCLMSPVALLYSVGGMKIDSVSMAFLLTGILFFRREKWFPAVIFSVLSGFLYPAYWPLGIGQVLYMTVGNYRKKRSGRVMGISLTLLAFFVILSVFVENYGGQGSYYWGKIFVIDSYTAEYYSGFGKWFLKMCQIYGYAFAMSILILSLRYKKLRILALLLQTVVTMYVGWQQTFYLAL